LIDRAERIAQSLHVAVREAQAAPRNGPVVPLRRP
jgi:hypothetical protein